tara:strand:- start:832 stop:2457 length:1626 start_codon:yes stop_codon:yes gene_type:complete
MVNNEVYTGAGLSASMIPELEFDLGALIDESGKNGTLIACGPLPSLTTTGSSFDSVKISAGTRIKLVTDLYKGCLATITEKNSSGADLGTPATAQTLRIKSNGSNSITFNQEISTTANNRFKIVIHGYGAPLPAPAADDTAIVTSADVWLGLVNTITPPTVDAELKQINLAMGGTRNFGYQYKAAETLGEASFDVALNNGSWLYYALGDMTYATSSLGGTSNEAGDTLITNRFYSHITSNTANATFHRVLDDYNGSQTVKRLFPPLASYPGGGTLTNYQAINTTDGIYPDILYNILENDSGDLPSFALEINAEKNNVSPYRVDANKESMFTRIYTGCQVNSLTLNFEEGQEVTASVSAMARKAHDCETNYSPRRGQQNVTDLINFEGRNTDDTNPFMFSDGSIKIFGQQMARVKGGSLSIANNLTAQRFIGNYDRTITSAHIAGQRTYDINLNLLITDRTIWDELRKQNETTDTSTTDELIELEFTKSNGEYIKFKFDDYLTTSVDIPFPDDKGALEVALTVSARTLATNGCQYNGNWIIL